MSHEPPPSPPARGGTLRRSDQASFGTEVDSSQAISSSSPKHLPYTINPETNRFEYYENYWKKVALELLLRHYPVRGKSLLDYGCGRGETLQIFGEAGFEVTGADVDLECVRLAGKHGKAVPLRAQAPLEQFGAKSFDVITCFHVMEHVDKPRETLEQLARIARQFVVVAVPNLRNLHGLFERRFELSLVNEGHLQGWDHLHLRNLAERYCGLELVEWASDATILSVLSNVSERVLGRKATIWLETGLFRRLFPFHSISVIGLFRVKSSDSASNV